LYPIGCDHGSGILIVLAIGSPIAQSDFEVILGYGHIDGIGIELVFDLLGDWERFGLS
jgi:hypothetical protein